MKREGISTRKAENFQGQKIQHLFIHKCCMTKESLEDRRLWGVERLKKEGEDPKTGCLRDRGHPIRSSHHCSLSLGQPCSIFLPQHLLGSPAKYLRNVILNSNSIFLFTLCLMLVLWKKRKKEQTLLQLQGLPYYTCIYNHPQNSFLNRDLQIKVEKHCHLRSVSKYVSLPVVPSAFSFVHNK